MIIFFGQKMAGKRNVIKGKSQCPYCSRYTKHTSYTARKFFHIYFIPLIPMGKKVRVFKECCKCKQGLHLPFINVEPLTNEYQQGIEIAIEAIQQNKKTCVINEHETDCTEYLHDITTEMCALNEIQYIDEIISALRQNNFDCQYNMMAASKANFFGHMEQAVNFYTEAARLDAQLPRARFELGQLQKCAKNLDIALQIFQQLDKEYPDDLSVKSELIEIYDAQGDLEALAQTYEQCFELNPDSKDDKNLVKHYKKICKKCGRPPII